MIPIRNVNPSDEAIKDSIKKKMEAKNVNVYDVLIQRSNQGTFIRSEVTIEPIDGKVLEKIDFEFLNCWVVPFYGVRIM